ncbi:MAG: porphobilinogen synthase [Dehalococcoidales bacterium]|nr:porphobilinogen synthase [Dehalococcoidales bacterium]MDP7310337.1 porphobilinogen synthase [Dehalococcoidales bacterium]MDP7409953.1 porphobilinogen synthase [Dehalococcoidales bacterium]MDP7675412.1 porphobilinogen synthase [Dehalococcoidales bacterium]HJM36467.1 porphobilinogen synthase [Dehalococcoidales bacterium]
MTIFQQLRLRRLRRSPSLRALIRENYVDTSDLIYPLFVEEGKNIKQEIPSMPGIFRFSPDRLPHEVEELATLKIPAIILFGIPQEKDEDGSAAYHPKGVIQQAIRTIKKTTPELLVATDVCLCEYTSHGHCGVVVNGDVDNDQTLPLLAKTALSHAAAGADIVAPSDMMDARIKTIRQELDEAGFKQIPILSYAAKYASAFYGPFREAAKSAPQFGDRRSYQMDPANLREALREVEADITEGADIIMIKPALAYLDVIRQVRNTFNCPLAAYNVSGEYAMVKAAVKENWLDERQVVMEIMTAIKRAGADIILTYHAKEVARWLGEK